MPPGDGHVVEEDVAVRVAARGGQVAVEAEPAARVRTAHDQEQRAALREGAERLRVREQVIAEVVLRPAQRDGRRGLARTWRARCGWPRWHPGPWGNRHGQLGTAVGAEPGAVGI